MSNTTKPRSSKGPPAWGKRTPQRRRSDADNLTEADRLEQDLARLYEMLGWAVAHRMPEALRSFTQRLIADVIAELGRESDHPRGPADAVELLARLARTDSALLAAHRNRLSEIAAELAL